MSGITVDNSIQVDINFKSVPFTRPEAPSIWSGKNIALWAINLITGGVYTSVGLIAKKHEIQILTLDQEELSIDIKELLKTWIDLESNISKLQQDIMQNEFDEKETLDSLRSIEKRVTLCANEELLRGPRTKSITQIALMPIEFFGTLIYNILTLGLYGVIKHHYLEHEIVCLEAKEKFTEKQINEDRLLQSKRLIEQIEALTDLVNIKSKIKLIGSTDTGKACLELAEKLKGMEFQLASLSQRYNKACTENKRLIDEITVLKASEVALKNTKRHFETRIEQYESQKSILVGEKSNLQLTINQNREQITSLTRDIETVRANLRDAQARATEANQQLEAARAQIAQLRVNPQISRQGQGTAVPAAVAIDKLGPIPPKYVPREDEKPSKGAFEIEEDGVLKVDLNSAHAKLYKGITLVELVVTAFDVTFDKLLKLSTPPVKVPASPLSAPKVKMKLNLNKNIEAMDDKMIPNTIYANLMLELLTGAKLREDTTDCHARFSVKFNDHVEVGSSSPMKVQAIKVSASDKTRSPEVRVVFSHTDELTPKAGFSGVPYGVDPVGAKMILNQLTPQEKEHLFNLINDPLIEDTHPELIATKAYLRAPQNAARAKLIKTAHELIVDMGLVIGNKYKNALQPHWTDKADENGKVFNKYPDLDTIDKIGTIDAKSVTEKAPQPMEWDIFKNIDCFAEDVILEEMVPNPQAPHLDIKVNVSLQQRISDMHLKYKTVADNMTRDLLVAPRTTLPTYTIPTPGRFGTTRIMTREIIPEDADQVLAMLKEQYYCSHIVFAPGCLFSSVLTSICCDTSMISTVTGATGVQYLKNAMSVFLNKEENKLKFAPLIAKFHKVTVTKPGPNIWPQPQTEIQEKQPMSVSDYQYWLVHGNTTYFQSIFVDSRDPSKGKKTILLDQSKDLGDVELTILGHLFGIRFLVFLGGEKIKIDTNGLIVPEKDGPEGYSYGPETGQYIALYNNKGSTFYALYPKLKVPRLASIDLKESIESLNKYWKYCQSTSNISGLLD